MVVAILEGLRQELPERNKQMIQSPTAGCQKAPKVNASLPRALCALQTEAKGTSAKWLHLASVIIRAAAPFMM